MRNTQSGTIYPDFASALRILQSLLLQHEHFTWRENRLLQQLGQFFSRQNIDSGSDVARAECLFTGLLLEHNIQQIASNHMDLLLCKMFHHSGCLKAVWLCQE